MGKHANLPFHFYVNIKNEFLGPNMPKGFTKGVWHGIYCKEYQTLMCHVLLESGANWSGLPIHALSTTEDFSIDRKDLMPWTSMGENMETFYSTMLEGLQAETLRPFKAKGRHTGIIIDWADGYSRYPQEHKPLNLIQLDSGQFALLPNNYVIYSDKHFVDEKARENLKFYKRGENIYWE
jgi:hypothetical protein